LPDPAETRNELRTKADRDIQVLRMFLDGLQELDPHSTGVTVASMLKTPEDQPTGHEAIRAAIAESIPSRDGKSPSSRSIGMKLHHLRRRVLGGRYLDSRDHDKGALWIVRRVDSPRD
jgi:hypothetical protein